MWGWLVQAIARLRGLGDTRKRDPRAIPADGRVQPPPVQPGRAVLRSPQPSLGSPLFLSPETVELSEDFPENSVQLTDGRRLERLGHCRIGGTLMVYRAHRLTEVDRNLAVQGLSLREASKLVALPAGLHIFGDFRLVNCPQLRSLPDGLRVSGSLIVRGCPRLESLGQDVSVGGDLRLGGRTRLITLRPDLSVEGHIVIEKAAVRFAPGFTSPRNLALIGCVGLRELPSGLRVGGDLIIRRCPDLTRLPVDLQIAKGLEARFAAIETLPDDIRVGSFIDLEGCRRLTSLPQDLVVPGALRLRRCTFLENLPGGLRIGLEPPSLRSEWHFSAVGPLETRSRLFRGLDLQGCSRLTALPNDLNVQGGIEVAGSGITALPFELRADLQLTWRGVAVPPRVAFQPESFDKAELLGYPNVEVRRVLMERVGPERLVTLLQPKVRDQDRDPGGVRRLLEVSLVRAKHPFYGPHREDPFVYLECRCPSTQRTYHLRVPPTASTCREAAAWIAGFENPDDYRPQLET